MSLLSLNTDVLASICQWLDNFSLRNLLICCKQLNIINQQQSLWLKLIVLTNLTIPINLDYNKIKYFYITTNLRQRVINYIKKHEPTITVTNDFDNLMSYSKVIYHLFNSIDFDLFLLSITYFNYIPNTVDDNDRRDNFIKFFKLIDYSKIKQIIVSSDLVSIINMQRIHEISNIDLVKMKIENSNYISNYQCAKAVANSYNNNDLATFNYLYHFCKNSDAKFIRLFALFAIEDDQLDLFIFLCNHGLNLFNILQEYGLVINNNFYNYIINKHYLTLLKYFKLLTNNNFKNSFKLYNKIDYLAKLTDIKFLLLDYLFNLPISKYRTGEDQIIKNIQSIVNSLSANELIDLYYLY